MPSKKSKTEQQIPRDLSELDDAWVSDTFADFDFDQASAINAEVLEGIPGFAIARLIGRFENDERRAILRRVSEEKAVEILEELDAVFTAEVLSEMREPRAVRILGDFDPDDAADILEELEDEDRARLLDKLEPKDAQEFQYLLNYDSKSAGGLMTTSIAKVTESDSVDAAIKELRRQREELETIYYLYVVDDQGKLLGVVSMREMLLAPVGSHIHDIMNTSLFGVCYPDDDREIVARRMSEHNLLAVPVVDRDSEVLLGIVTHDDVIDVVQELATEDLQILVGAGGDEGIHDKISYSLQKRSPWLLVNLLTACGAAAIVFLFQDEIQQLTLLAVFMPVVASLAGNTGSQTLAVAIRSLAVDEVRSKDSLEICLREASKGLLNGLAIGAVAAILAWFVSGELPIAWVVFLAMVLSLSVSGFSGALIPLTLKRFNQDPAQSASIFLTAVSDIAGFFIFLKLGTWLLL
ncbi:MAG: magnesium transporter [Verrucomicrobiota bacterium]